MIKGLKQTIDPQNIFATGNLVWRINSIEKNW